MAFAAEPLIVSDLQEFFHRCYTIIASMIKVVCTSKPLKCNFVEKPKLNLLRRKLTKNNIKTTYGEIVVVIFA